MNALHPRISQSTRSLATVRVLAALSMAVGVALVPSAAHAFTVANPPTCAGITVALSSDPMSDDPVLDKLIKTVGPTERGPFPLGAPIPAGTYSVNAVSADPSHATSASYHEQPAEQWVVDLLDASNNVVGTTPVTPDLDADLLIQGWPAIGDVTVSGTATQWKVRHAQLPSTDIYDSVRPVCFGLVAAVVPTTTTTTTTSSTSTTSTTSTTTPPSTTTTTPGTTTTTPPSTTTPTPTTTGAPTTPTTPTTLPTQIINPVPPTVPLVTTPAPTTPPATTAPAAPATTVATTTPATPPTTKSTPSTTAPSATVLGVTLTSLPAAPSASVAPSVTPAYTGSRSATLALLAGILLVLGAMVLLATSAMRPGVRPAKR